MVGKSRRPRHRPGDLVVLAPHKKVIPPYDGKPIVGREDVLRVSSIIGTGSKRSPHLVVLTDGVSFWHLDPDDVIPAPESSVPSRGSATKKSAAQLEREIQDILAGGDDDMTIVVAWTEDVQEIAPGQKPWRHDLGERPRFVDAKKAHATVWLNRGAVADVDKARAHVQRNHPETGRVFAYRVSEKDPLGRARKDVLAGR